MSILLAFQGAPPAAPDHIETISIFEFEFEFETIDLHAEPFPIGADAAPAAIDLIETIYALDFELEFDEPFVQAEPVLIGDNAFFETIAVAEPELGPDDEPVEFLPSLIEDDAPILLVTTEPEGDEDEPAPSFSIADIFLPDGGEEIIVAADAAIEEDDDPAVSFAIPFPTEDALVADPGEVIETWASVVFIPRPDDPNDHGLFVGSHAPFDDAPVAPAEGADDYIIRVRRRGRR